MLPRLFKRAIKLAAPTLVFRDPHSALGPERLYLYLDALWTRRDVQGAVVEVGAYLGGTAAYGAEMLRNLDIKKEYICVDTFAGFVGQQFDRDVPVGVRVSQRHTFDSNSIGMVRRLLDHYGVPEVQLVQADISTIDERRLPSEVSVALVDVDLEVPTFDALERLLPRMSKGGILLVDDCGETDEWKGARIAYERFAAARGLTPTYRFGMGVVEC